MMFAPSRQIVGIASNHHRSTIIEHVICPFARIRDCFANAPSAAIGNLVLQAVAAKSHGDVKPFHFHILRDRYVGGVGDAILFAFSMPIVCLVLTELLRVLMIFASKGRIKSFCHRGSQG